MTSQVTRHILSTFRVVRNHQAGPGNGMINLRDAILRRDISIMRGRGQEWYRAATQGQGPTRACSSNQSSSTSPDSKKKEKSAEEKLAANPYYEKYQDKIKSAIQQGDAKPGAAAEADPLPVDEYEKKEREKYKEAAHKLFDRMDQEKTAEEVKSGKYQPKSSAKSQRAGLIAEHLEEIVRLDLLEAKSAEEIGAIWNEHHKSLQCLYAVIPTEYYSHLASRAKEYPLFVYPLPRTPNTHQEESIGMSDDPKQNKEGGYELFLAQFSGNFLHFTPLMAYQLHKENAPVCMTIGHYTELSATKQIVLMRGEYDPQVLSSAEAQCLANQVQIYYGTVAKGQEKEPNRAAQLLHRFNKEPARFSYLELIQHFERTTLGGSGKLAEFFKDLKL